MNFVKKLKNIIIFIIFITYSNKLSAQKEDVKWTKKEGVIETTNNKQIEKTSTTGVNNSNAKTKNILKAGEDGEVEFKVADLVSNFIIGLTPFNKDNRYESIAYSFHISSTQVQIIENGTIIMSAGSVGLNDILKIQRNGSEIKYYKNNINIRNISTNSNYELVIDVSMITSGSKVKEVRADFRQKLDAFAFITNLSVNDLENNKGIIDVNPTGGSTPYTYHWSNGATTKYINNLEQGLYTVQITDALGNIIKQSYLIASQVTAFIPLNYVNDNGLIIKHQNSDNNTDMMVSKNIIKNSGWTIASFKGNDISVIFGLDTRENDFQDSKNIEKGITIIHNEMFYIKKGKVIARLGRYFENESISFIVNDNQLSVYKNELLLIRDELLPKAYYSKIALSKNSGSLATWNHSGIWHYNGKTDYYATLTKKLDGSYYEMTNYVNFKYKEKYNNHDLNYKIYDWKRNVKMSNTGITNHAYGINYHSIAAYNQLNSEIDGFYTLEVENNKKEIYKMRFKFTKEGNDDGVVIIGHLPDIGVETDYVQSCCVTLPLCKCLPMIVNPCNPCVAITGNHLNLELNYTQELTQNWP